MHALKMYETLPPWVKRLVPPRDVIPLLFHFRVRDTIAGMFGRHEDPRLKPYENHPRSVYEGYRSTVAGFVAGAQEPLEEYGNRVANARRWWRIRKKLGAAPRHALKPPVGDLQLAVLEALERMVESEGRDKNTPRSVLADAPPWP